MAIEGRRLHLLRRAVEHPLLRVTTGTGARGRTKAIEENHLFNFGFTPWERMPASNFRTSGGIFRPSFQIGPQETEGKSVFKGPIFEKKKKWRCFWRFPKGLWGLKEA